MWIVDKRHEKHIYINRSSFVHRCISNFSWSQKITFYLCLPNNYFWPLLNCLKYVYWYLEFTIYFAKHTSFISVAFKWLILSFLQSFVNVSGCLIILSWIVTDFTTIFVCLWMSIMVGVIFWPGCDKFDTWRKMILICVFYFGLKRMKDFLKCDICNGFDGCQTKIK